MRKILALLFALAIAATGVVAAPASAASDDAERPTPEMQLARQPLRFVTAVFSGEQFNGLREAGFDVLDARPSGATGQIEADLIVNGLEMAELQEAGVQVTTNSGGAGVASRSLRLQEAPSGFNVWRTWSEPGGLREEMEALAAEYPDITKIVKFGESIQGQDLLAMRVTKNADRGDDGSKPTVMYASLQHAREWIVGEMTRRLLRHYLEGYGTDSTVTELIDGHEMWFILVANPDGYDHTFTEGNRLWRKNLADNDGDGEITGFDGVDLNRNWPFNWGYDNEGSSPNQTSAVYRGERPASEPETRALDLLVRKLKPEFFMNYHSAAELLLYGNGWQVSTPEPDDNLHVAILGDDENPAVAGYDPDPSAELYTTNGTTTGHLTNVAGVVAYTPELDTCESAEDILPDDEFGDTFCESEGRSGFEFPDDETLVQLVFEKNLPLALAIAQSAADPDNPISVLGTEAPSFNIDPFEVSYNRTQPVAVEMKKSFGNRRMHYTINGGSERRTNVSEWTGGEVYGHTGTEYYAEYRGVVRNTNIGDEVTVWFTATDGRERVTSEPFTYNVAIARPARVLLLVNEDYLGFDPQQPGVTSPVFGGTYVDAIRAANYTVDVWDVSRQGVPHHLGVLSHYDLIVWETGDNKLTQEASDVSTPTFLFGPLPDISVAESQQYLTVAVRDWINEGGRLLQTGEYVGYYGLLGSQVGGAYFGLNGDEAAPCVISASFFGDCLIYSDDFAQYYQGVFARSDFGAPELVEGKRAKLFGTFNVDGAEVPNSGAFQVTSDVLPRSEFPQFSSFGAMDYVFDGAPPFSPFAGDFYQAATHNDAAWMRLTQEIDLTGATSAELAFKLSYNLEGGYDHVIVEARTAGGSDYTTLAEANGGTSTQVPTECEAGFFAALHPALANYLTIDAAGCSPSGATGDWNSFSGDSGGWGDALFDLSAYAGSTVEVSISYVTDPNTGGTGVFVDDTVVTVDGTATTTDFESDSGAWTVPGPPAGSPGNGTDWIRSENLFPVPSAAVSTKNTLTFGFGLEALATADERATVIRQALGYLRDQG